MRNLLAEVTGIEPVNVGVKVQCVAISPYPNMRCCLTYN